MFPAEPFNFRFKQHFFLCLGPGAAERSPACLPHRLCLWPKLPQTPTWMLLCCGGGISKHILVDRTRASLERGDGDMGVSVYWVSTTRLALSLLRSVFQHSLLGTANLSILQMSLGAVISQRFVTTMKYLSSAVWIKGRFHYPVVSKARVQAVQCRGVPDCITSLCVTLAGIEMETSKWSHLEW